MDTNDTIASTTVVTTNSMKSMETMMCLCGANGSIILLFSTSTVSDIDSTSTPVSVQQGIYI